MVILEDHLHHTWASIADLGTTISDFPAETTIGDITSGIKTSVLCCVP